MNQAALDNINKICNASASAVALSDYSFEESHIAIRAAIALLAHAARCAVNEVSEDRLLAVDLACKLGVFCEEDEVIAQRMLAVYQQ